MAAANEDRKAWVEALRTQAVSRFGNDRVVEQLGLSDDELVDGCIACELSHDDVLNNVANAVSKALEAHRETSDIAPMRF